MNRDLTVLRLTMQWQIAAQKHYLHTTQYILGHFCKIEDYPKMHLNSFRDHAGRKL
jgi:hypothetical protein